MNIEAPIQNSSSFPTFKRFFAINGDHELTFDLLNLPGFIPFSLEILQFDYILTDDEMKSTYNQLGAIAIAVDEVKGFFDRNKMDSKIICLIPRIAGKLSYNNLAKTQWEMMSSVGYQISTLTFKLYDVSIKPKIEQGKEKYQMAKFQNKYILQFALYYISSSNL